MVDRLYKFYVEVQDTSQHSRTVEKEVNKESVDTSDLNANLWCKTFYLCGENIQKEDMTKYPRY